MIAGRIWTRRSAAPPTRSPSAEKPHGANAIGAVIGAHATNEEAFALKSLIKDAIGSDRSRGLSCRRRARAATTIF